jgi:predicted alpha/beta superfamily hydrolase
MRWSLLVLLACGAVGTPQAGPTAPAVREPVKLLDTEVHSFRSKITGYEYVISIALPPFYQRDKAARFPVLYLLDANATFATVTETARLLQFSNQISPILIVGVAVAAKQPSDNMRFRNSVYTPTPNEKVDAELSKALDGEVHTGEAPRFLRSLKEEIVPLVDSTYRTSADRGLAGFSLSGLFTGYSLLNSPETFQRYLLVSPSLWWGDGSLLKQAAQLANDGPQKGRNVFIAFGSEEEKDIVESSQEMARLLRKHSGVQVDLRTAEGENHFSGLAGNYSRGLRSLYARRRPATKSGDAKPQ